MNHPRNLIVAEENSQVTVVEDYVSLGEGITFSNAATELVAGENAHVSHYMIVREGGAGLSTFPRCASSRDEHANVATHSLLLGGALVRNNVHPVLAGEGSECLINGLFMANGRQHMDNYMLVEHASPHCDSRQFYNGILNGQRTACFTGGSSCTKTRRRRMPSRPTATCCFPTMRRSIPSRSWKFTRTT